MTYVNCKVTAALLTPIAQDPPHLDGLLELVMSSRMKAVQESRNGERHAFPIAMRGQEIDRDAIGKIPIPIARRFVDGVPIPLCSSPICGEASSDTASHFTSAFPLGRGASLSEKEQTKVRQSGGRFKSFRLPLRTRLIDRVVWFCVLRKSHGDPMREVRKLLRGVDHIGKKTSQGHGMIRSWTVEPCEHDWSWFAHVAGGPILMRPLPLTVALPKGLHGARRSFGGVHGPYWDRRFWCEMVEPC